MTAHIDTLPTDVELERRVFGIEAEHGITGEDASDRMIAATLFVKNISDIPGLYTCTVGNRRFLSNGACAYVDVGQHVEYASPECLTIQDLLAADWAGRLLLREVSTQVSRDIQYNHFLNTRVVDSNGQTWGSHENYRTSSDLEVFRKDNLGTMIAHLVTRNVLLGAGRSVPYSSDAFVLSQKTGDISLAAASGSTLAHKKPYMLTRQEHHAAVGHSRVQIVGGDPTMSPWATAVRFGSTSLVLRLIEAGVDLSELAPRTIWKAGNTVSHDLTFKEKIELDSGKSMSPVDIQLTLAELCLEFAKSNPVPEEELKIADEWVTGLEDLKADPQRLVDRADWAAKYHLIQRVKEEKNYKPTDMAWLVDQWWGELRPRGRAMMLVENGKMQDPLNALGLAETYKLEPPEGRAKLRGDFIKYARKLGATDIAAAWTGVKSQKLNSSISLQDPYGESEKAQRKVARLRQVVSVEH